MEVCLYGVQKRLFKPQDVVTADADANGVVGVAFFFPGGSSSAVPLYIYGDKLRFSALDCGYPNVAVAQLKARWAERLSFPTPILSCFVLFSQDLLAIPEALTNRLVLSFLGLMSTSR